MKNEIRDESRWLNRVHRPNRRQLVKLKKVKSVMVTKEKVIKAIRAYAHYEVVPDSELNLILKMLGL